MLGEIAEAKTRTPNIFTRVINKTTGGSVSSAKVTADNLETIRTLWRQPKAEIGMFLIKDQKGTQRLVKPERFRKMYRYPN